MRYHRGNRAKHRKHTRHPDPEDINGRIGATTVDGAGRHVTAVDGADAGIVAGIRALRAAGATEVEVSWAAEGHDGKDDAPPGVACVWTCRATFDDGQLVGQCEPTTDHMLGVLQAVANVLRAGGATVDLVDGSGL